MQMRRVGARLTAAVVTVVCVSGCEMPAGQPARGDRSDPGPALAQVIEGRPTLRIVPENGGPRTYLFGADSQPVGLAELTGRLEAARRLHPSETTLHLYTYPGVNGYDVAMATQAAERAGFRRVEGIADYSDDDSPVARARWKRWSEMLVAAPRGAARPDTTARG